MINVDSIEGLLKAINHGDSASLKVMKNKKGSIKWKETAGTVTIKIPERGTFTMSKETFAKIEGSLY